MSVLISTHCQLPRFELVVELRVCLTGGTMADGRGPMSVCEEEGLGCQSCLCVRQVPLFEIDQGRAPGGYSTQMDG